MCKWVNWSGDVEGRSSLPRHRKNWFFDVPHFKHLAIVNHRLLIMLTSYSDYRGSFRAIAGFAEKLNITCCVTTAFRHRYDMVILKPLLASAFNAFSTIPLPHFHLNFFRYWLSLTIIWLVYASDNFVRLCHNLQGQNRPIVNYHLTRPFWCVPCYDTYTTSTFTSTIQTAIHSPSNQFYSLLPVSWFCETTRIMLRCITELKSGIRSVQEPISNSWVSKSLIVAPRCYKSSLCLINIGNLSELSLVISWNFIPAVLQQSKESCCLLFLNFKSCIFHYSWRGVDLPVGTRSSLEIILGSSHSPQNWHFLASFLISSAQYGPFITVNPHISNLSAIVSRFIDKRNRLSLW